MFWLAWGQPVLTSQLGPGGRGGLWCQPSSLLGGGAGSSLVGDGWGGCEPHGGGGEDRRVVLGGRKDSDPLRPPSYRLRVCCEAPESSAGSALPRKPTADDAPEGKGDPGVTAPSPLAAARVLRDEKVPTQEHSTRVVSWPSCRVQTSARRGQSQVAPWFLAEDSVRGRPGGRGGRKEPRQGPAGARTAHR